MMRAGMALVFVLGILVLVLAAVSVWLGAGVRSALATHTWSAENHVWAQEQAAERLVVEWLTLHGGALVAPPDGGAWTILADRWASASASGWLTVTVYDGWSGIPPHLAGPRGILRRALPSELSGVIATTLAPGTSDGTSDALARWDPPVGYRTFPAVPSGPGSSARTLLGPGVSAPSFAPASVPLPTPNLATVLSPHSDGRINCNTAPVPLVEQVLRAYGGLTLTDLRRNRQKGLPTLPPPDPGGAPGHPVLVATSGVWQAHITAGYHGLIRSWWVVVVGSGPVPRIVQRHVVDP